jgi:release factor glutamine methyltransferase
LWEAADREAARFESLLRRREAHEPFAYITGQKEFWSLDFKVGPGVLIPRPDTETIVERALALFPDRAAPLAIADLGTGSGALLIALLKEFPAATGTGFESAPQAMAFARANVAALGMANRAELILADWSAAPAAAFDLVVSNPPYIPSADIQTLEPEVRDHEPRAALDGGPDGLAAYRALAGLLPAILKPGGTAVLEIGAGQDVAMEPLFRGLEFQGVTPDLAGIPRALTLKKPK